jgi:2-keto-4-pentenoate hydratase/2-oxohepta-3-ene-1,7-dioic acid hydratase in catechol pathway
MVTKGILMSLDIVRFSKESRVYWGVYFRGEISVIPSIATTLKEFINNDLEKAWEIKKGRVAGIEKISFNQVEVLSPVTHPCNVICQGTNYVDHLLETGGRNLIHPKNIIFTKASSSIRSPSGAIHCPPRVNLLDYELELGLIVGKPIIEERKFTNDNLHEAIIGVVMVNDISARDVQIPEGQWFRGKSFRGFCPVGPILSIFEKDEFNLLSDFVLKLEVNGKIRQQACSGQMIHKPAETLSLLSETLDLYPGDLILTGTPSGVALKAPSFWVQHLVSMFLRPHQVEKLFLALQMKNPNYLKNGDQIVSSIRTTKGEIDLGVQNLIIA